MQLESNNIKKIQHLSGLVYIFSAGGVDVYRLTDWTRQCWAALANIISGTVNDNGIYLATSDRGVYRLIHGHNGESSHLLTRTYGVDTTPSLLANSCQCIDGAGTNLLITTTAGVNFLPSISKSYAYEADLCGDCSVGPEKIAYIVDTNVHVIAHPVANWVAADVEVLSVEPDPATPAMTGDTTPSGTASASSVLDTGYLAYEAFDQVVAVDYTNCWISGTGIDKVPSWLQYEFPVSVKIMAYRFRTRFGIDDEYTYTYPANFELQGWTGTEWDTLHSYTGLTGLGPNEDTEIFLINNSDYYTKYRLYITAVTAAGAGDFVCVGELELFTMPPLLDEPNVINYETENMFVGSNSGITVYDANDYRTDIITPLGSVLDIKSLYPTSSGLLAYGTSNGAAGGRFGILDLATSTNLVTESGDTLAVYTSEDSNSAIADDTLLQYGAVRDIVPAAGAIGVSRCWTLYAVVTDTVNGIATDSVVLKINGTTVSPTVTAITDGYRVDYSGSSSYTQPVTALLTATDGDSNPISRSWSWQTEAVTVQDTSAAPPNVVCIRDLSLAAGEYDELVDSVGVIWLPDHVSPLIVTEAQASEVGRVLIDGVTYHRHLRSIDVAATDADDNDTADLQEGNIITLSCAALSMTSQKCEVLAIQRRFNDADGERFVLTVAYYEAVA